MYYLITVVSTLLFDILVFMTALFGLLWLFSKKEPQARKKLKFAIDDDNDIKEVKQLSKRTSCSDRREMDTANAELSKCLHEVLDDIGASLYNRKKFWELAMLHEITLTFTNHLYAQAVTKKSLYQVGSSCEGTTTVGLESDIDTISCFEHCPVVDKLVNAKAQGTSYLILTDENTKPGYVRLQYVRDNCLMSYERYDVSEDNRIYSIHPIRPYDEYYIQNGPADTLLSENGNSPLDSVYAVRCRQIPMSANSWLHRKRKYNWPSQTQLQAMGSYGCFFVCVGHPHSDYKPFEWRISFSLQERDLMSSLNETQHKCYILLKMIKKSIIEPRAGASISSYHCKTSLFYTIENSQRHFWTDDKLIPCAHQCLKRLFIWVKANNCPNYFIPEENMFDKLSPVTMNKVENVLNDIIESVVNNIYTLTCDNVGELLKSKMYGSELNRSLCNKFDVNCDIAVTVYHLRNGFLQHMDVLSKTFTSYMIETIHILLYLHDTNNVTEHSSRDVRQALDSIIPHIQLQYDQNLFVQYLSQENELRLIPKITHNLTVETSSDCDLLSSKLALASFYIQFEMLEEKCKRILVSCQNSLKPYVMSICGCTDMARKQIFDGILTSENFRRQHTTGCMAFLPHQVSLVHKVLQYEMFRKVYTHPDSEWETNTNYWLNWITVDSRIYLHFLQYLLHSKNKKTSQQETAVQTLTHLLKTDPNLGHKETAFNLCGWIRLQESDVPGAWRLFCTSWKARPFLNAAKWHMLILLGEVLTGK